MLNANFKFPLLVISNFSSFDLQRILRCFSFRLHLFLISRRFLDLLDFLDGFLSNHILWHFSFWFSFLLLFGGRLFYWLLCSFINLFACFYGHFSFRLFLFRWLLLLRILSFLGSYRFLVKDFTFFNHWLLLFWFRLLLLAGNRLLCIFSLDLWAGLGFGNRAFDRLDFRAGSFQLWLFDNLILLRLFIRFSNHFVILFRRLSNNIDFFIVFSGYLWLLLLLWFLWWLSFDNSLSFLLIERGFPGWLHWSFDKFFDFVFWNWRLFFDRCLSAFIGGFLVLDNGGIFFVRLFRLGDFFAILLLLDDLLLGRLGVGSQLGEIAFLWFLWSLRH